MQGESVATIGAGFLSVIAVIAVGYAARRSGALGEGS